MATLLLVSPFFLCYFAWRCCLLQIKFLSSRLDNGVTAALQCRLVKGNPVKVRNYTRSCESVDAQVVK